MNEIKEKLESLVEKQNLKSIEIELEKINKFSIEKDSGLNLAHGLESKLGKIKNQIIEYPIYR